MTLETQGQLQEPLNSIGHISCHFTVLISILLQLVNAIPAPILQFLCINLTAHFEIQTEKELAVHGAS
jgi:hypothetical protein